MLYGSFLRSSGDACFGFSQDAKKVLKLYKVHPAPKRQEKGLRRESSFAQHQPWCSGRTCTGPTNILVLEHWAMRTRTRTLKSMPSRAEHAQQDARHRPIPTRTLSSMLSRAEQKMQSMARSCPAMQKMHKRAWTINSSSKLKLRLEAQAQAQAQTQPRGSRLQALAQGSRSKLQILVKAQAHDN